MLAAVLALLCCESSCSGRAEGVGGAGAGSGARLPPRRYAVLSLSGSSAHNRPRTASRFAFGRLGGKSSRCARQNAV